MTAVNSELILGFKINLTLNKNFTELCSGEKETFLPALSAFSLRKVCFHPPAKCFEVEGRIEGCS